MTTELKPCPKCYSNRVTCWNVTGGNQIVCKDCGLRNKPHPIETVVRDDWNTRAVPDVPEDKLILELDRYDPVHIHGRVVGMETNKFGDYVSYNQVTALVAVKDVEFGLQAIGLNIAKTKIKALEYKLNQLEAQDPVGWLIEHDDFSAEFSKQRLTPADLNHGFREQPLYPVTPKPDYFGSLVSKARSAAAKASEKFPQPNYTTLKIAEEAGEVVRGAVHYAEGRMPWSEVEGEIVQLMAMLIRFVTEGDQINGVIVPEPKGEVS